MKNSFLLLAVFLTLSACSSAPPSDTKSARKLPTNIEEAISSPYRKTDNLSRDKYRHPAETLKFFGLKPNMTVVEISPGGGWYMEILAPLLNDQGQYIAALMPSTSEYMIKANTGIMDWIKAQPELSGKIKTVEFNPPAALDAEGTADMVVTFRNVHNWMSKNNGQAAFESFFKTLKPGGILGVVEHRAKAKSKFDPKAKSGYVRQADVIKMAKKAGFKLDAQSEINANAKDKTKHPEGVWSLPPVLRLGDKDRDKYMDIGESDRMTLRFIKPAKK